MRYEILDDAGNVVNTILADADFVAGMNCRLVQTSDPVVIDPCASLIDVGAFFDRFGAYKYPILMSSDGAVQAYVKDVQVRPYIDLARVDIAPGLDYLIVKGVMDAATKTAVLAVPVAASENALLRKEYFS